MHQVRRPQVTPTLQPAAYGQTPVHTDPQVRLTGRTLQPVEHRGEVWQPASPAPNWRPSVLVHPNIIIAPPTLIGDQTGDQTVLPSAQAHIERGMPASTWALRRNYRPVASVEPGETEI